MPENSVESYAWFLLAKGNERANEVISNLEKRLTVEQGKKAQARALELRRLIEEKERKPEAVR